VTTLFRAHGLTGGYGQVAVLRDVTIDVAENEVVAVFGANGAGKTTLLRAISGALPSCRGSIELDGIRLDRKKPWHRAALGLAHVPEGRHVFAGVTVAENLGAAALLGRPGFSIDDVFAIFPRLHERRSQVAGSLSGGEQQMLAIARALISGPRLLAIDEMSAGLAPTTAQSLVDTLATIRGRGLGVLLVEQSPQLVEQLVDRVYLLEGGRVVGSGTLSELGGADGLAAVYLGVG
jgi:branched-chain amino acid transport system ATP-binding protein